MKSRPMLLWCGALLLGGCASWNPLAVRSQSPEESAQGGSKVRLVGDLAAPFGMYPVQGENVALVTGLRGTGSDPAPSPQRAELLADMQRRGVVAPNRVLGSTDTAMVLLRGVLRPGIQKGDRFDVEVRIPSRSETTSLRGGWLMPTELKEMAVLKGEIHDGHILGLAQGAVLVDPSAEPGKNSVLAARGRILGGGVALKSRSLGLVLKPGRRHVLNSSRIANAVNKRFHFLHNGIKSGVAKAKTDEFIELAVHPRYKDNIRRYVDVVRAIGIRESATQRAERLALLEKQLLDPITAGSAARQLEAIGHQGVEVLIKGIRSNDREVRFCSAEALAYLDRREAAKPLGEAAREEPAFRVFALTALSTMDDGAACDELHDLLNVPSAETRYGAFRALWAMNRNNATVLGESLRNQFSYHVLSTSGPPMIHVTRSRRPEIVLFGKDQRLKTPLYLEAGTQIMVKSPAPGQIAVSKFSVAQQDQKRIVSDQVDEVIRAIVELGGTYPDVVQALQQAKASGALTSRFEVDAQPEAGRKYDRLADDQSHQPESTNSRLLAGNPLPELFKTSLDKPSRQRWGMKGRSGTKGSDHPESNGNRHPVRAFFAKMTGRSSD